MVTIVDRCVEIQGNRCFVRMGTNPEADDLLRIQGYGYNEKKYSNLKIDPTKAQDLIDVLIAYVELKKSDNCEKPKNRN